VESLDTFPMQKWDLLIQIMLVGVARLTQAVLPTMKSQNFGRVINIGSLHALEVAELDITINTLCPAYVKTPLVDMQVAAQAKEHQLTEEEVVRTIMLEPMPKKAFITTEELAATCEFLMSHHARNITAQAIALDGGWTAR